MFEIPEDGRYVAKVYPRERPDLNVLVEASATRGLQERRIDGLIMAAPRWVLSEHRRSPPIGCVMPRIDPECFDSLDLFNLHLARTAPLSDRVRTAHVLADAVSWLHNSNLVVGDLKPDNILRHDDGFPLAIIDVDSFCVLDDSGRYLYRRTALTEKYRAPELGAGAWPTYASDDFALGVVILEILFGGVHPYLYVAKDRVDDDVQGRIEHGQSWLLDVERFHAAEGHPGAAALPRSVAGLVERMHSVQTRPAAAEWAKGLEELVEVPCATDASHSVFEYGDCVTCALARAPAPTVIQIPPAGPVVAAGDGLGWLVAAAAVVILFAGFLLLRDGGDADEDNASGTMAAPAATACPAADAVVAAVGGVAVSRIDESCAYSYQGAGAEVVCPAGWICTLSLSGTAPLVVQEGGSQRYANVEAATLRYKASYPSEDPVHDLCALARKEGDLSGRSVSAAAAGGEQVAC